MPNIGKEQEMFLKHFKIVFMGLCCVALTGCLGMGGLSHKQVKMLKKQGFVQTDEGWSLGLPERLLFDFNEADISNQNQTQLTKLAEQLQKYKLNKVRIVGHTDNIGNPEYNQKLSEKRAQSVAHVFESNHFQQNNIQIVGKGAAQPVNQANTEEARAENRRVAVIIVP